jgi:hypothetical protein
MLSQFNQVGGFTLYLAKIHFNIIPSARTEISTLVKRPETGDWCSVLGSGMDFSLRHHVHTNFGSFQCPLGPFNVHWDPEMLAVGERKCSVEANHCISVCKLRLPCLMSGHRGGFTLSSYTSSMLIYWVVTSRRWRQYVLRKLVSSSPNGVTSQKTYINITVARTSNIPAHSPPTAFCCEVSVEVLDSLYVHLSP